MREGINIQSEVASRAASEAFDPAGLDPMLGWQRRPWQNEEKLLQRAKALPMTSKFASWIGRGDRMKQRNENENLDCRSRWIRVENPERYDTTRSIQIEPPRKTNLIMATHHSQIFLTCTRTIHYQRKIWPRGGASSRIGGKLPVSPAARACGSGFRPHRTRTRTTTNKEEQIEMRVARNGFTS